VLDFSQWALEESGHKVKIGLNPIKLLASKLLILLVFSTSLTAMV
jgi:hypothetical protein